MMNKIKGAFAKDRLHTTLCGLGSILTALGSFLTAAFDNDVTTEPNWAVIISAVVVGIGLIRAADATKKKE